MKLRVRGNSIRLRLTRSEVDALAKGQTITERCALTAVQAFETELTGWLLDAFQAQLDQHTLRLSVPLNAVRQWASNDTEGIYGEQENGEAEPLRIAVEKDYSCLVDRPDEDESEHFPHPDKGSRSC